MDLALKTVLLSFDSGCAPPSSFRLLFGDVTPLVYEILQVISLRVARVEGRQMIAALHKQVGE